MRKFLIGCVASMMLMAVSAPALLMAATPTPQATGAATAPDLRRYSEGGFSLVQCDGVADKSKGEVQCNFSTLIKQIQFLINWMFRIGVVLMVGILAYVGALFMSTDPKKITEAKGIFPKVVQGFVIMLLAWLIVRTLLLWIAAPGFGTDLLQ